MHNYSIFKANSYMSINNMVFIIIKQQSRIYIFCSEKFYNKHVLSSLTFSSSLIYPLQVSRVYQHNETNTIPKYCPDQTRRMLHGQSSRVYQYNETHTIVFPIHWLEYPMTGVLQLMSPRGTTTHSFFVNQHIR